MKKFALVLMTMAFGACGDDSSSDGYVGTYEVVSHTLIDNGCGNAAVPVTEETNCFSCLVEKPFFKIKMQSFFGQNLHVLVDCDDAATCDDDGDDPNTINLGGAFFDRNGDGGRIGTADAAAYGGSCSYTGVRMSMVQTDDGLKLTRTETRLKAGAASESLDSDACLDLTDNPPPADELECQSIEEILGRAPAAK